MAEEHHAYHTDTLFTSATERPQKPLNQNAWPVTLLNLQSHSRVVQIAHPAVDSIPQPNSTCVNFHLPDTRERLIWNIQYYYSQATIVCTSQASPRRKMGVSGLLSSFKLIVVKFVLADTESFELSHELRDFDNLANLHW